MCTIRGDIDEGGKRKHQYDELEREWHIRAL